MSQLNRHQKRRVLSVLEEGADYKKLKTPEEWHQLALHWNWDAGLEAMNWIVDHKDCDAGTALLIFWRGNAPFFYQYKDRVDALAQVAYAIDSYDLVHKIAARYQAGFYTRQQFCYDPNDVEEDFVREIEPQTLRQPFPEAMTHASAGRIVNRDELVAVRVRPLTEKEMQKVQRHLARGWKILHEHRPGIKVTSEPAEIVRAIALAVAKYPTVTKKDSITELGWIWDDQLRRAANWQWLCWDAETQQIPMIFSPDQRYYSTTWFVIAHFTDPREKADGLNLLFNSIVLATPNAERLKEIVRAGYGACIRFNPYFRE